MDRDKRATRRVVALAASLDTKRQEAQLVKTTLAESGVDTLVLDFGVMGPPRGDADVGSAEIASAGGGDLARLQAASEKSAAMSVMASGLAVTVARLFDRGALDGIIGIGGSSGTSIVTEAMRELPLGVPKVMVTTLGGTDTSWFARDTDIVFIPSIADIAGLNHITRRVLRQAAAAVAAMTNLDLDHDRRGPLVGASMFGNTTPCVDRVRKQLEELGYEVLVFHASGIGGRMLEALARSGELVACVDITTTELADEVCGGLYSSGPTRTQAAPTQGVPTVLVPGCVDMVNFGPPATVPDRYSDRVFYRWNADVTLMRTNSAECAEIGGMLAAALNLATGPIAAVLPLGGLSMLDKSGGPFWDPDADAACLQAIRSGSRPGTQVVESPAHINDPEFADTVVTTLLGIMSTAPVSLG